MLRLDDDNNLTGVVEEPPLPGRQRGAALLLIAVVVLGLLAVRARTGEEVAATAFTPRGDAARSGVVSLGSLGAPTEVAWRATVTGNGGWAREHLALSRDHVAVAGRDGVSLHTRGGELLWHRPDIAAAAQPAISDDTLVVFDFQEPSRGRLRDAQVAERGRLRGLAVADGSTRWSLQLQHGPPEVANHPAGLIVRDGHRGLALLDAETGRERWRFDSHQEIAASVREVLAGDSAGTVHVFVSRPAGFIPADAAPDAVSEYLVALDAETGTPRFEVAPVLGLAENPFAIQGGTIWGIGDGSLLSWDATTGEQIGVVRHSLAAEMERIVAHEDLVVTIHESGTLIALDVDTGGRRWGVRNPVGNADEVRVAGGRLLVRAGDRLASVDLDNGATTGTFELPLGASISATDEDGGFATAGDGRLVFRGADNGVEADWPTITPTWPAPIVNEESVAVVTARETALFDLESGENRWRLVTSNAERRTPTDSVGPPVLASGLLVFSPPRDEDDVAREGLAAVDLVQAVFRWDRSDDDMPPTGPLTLADDTVFLPVGDEIHGHSVETGRRSFAARVGHARGPIAAHPEYVIAATDRRAIADDPRTAANLTAIRRADRSNAWEQPLDACTPPVVTGDLVLAATLDGISAHDVHRGGNEWFAGLPEPGCTDLAVANGTVVAAPGRDALAAFSTSGAPRWTQPLDGVLTAPPTIAGDTILAPLHDGTIAGLDLGSGEVLWRFDLGAVPASSVTVADGRLLVVTRDRELVAVATS